MSNSQRSFLQIVFILSILSGCRTPSPIDAEAKALVTPEQFARAYSLVDDVKTYVPFNEPGICFARALFMSLALASESIPSSAHFVFATDQMQPLRNPDGHVWQYHVGMMIRANDSQEQMIFDPALSDRPIVDHQWIRRMTSGPTRSVLVPGSVYAEQVVRGGQSGWWFIEKFEDMPAFKQQDIENACGQIERYQSMLGTDSRTARGKLHRETIRFSNTMEALGKLDWGSLTPGSVYCGRTKIFPAN